MVPAAPAVALLRQHLLNDANHAFHVQRFGNVHAAADFAFGSAQFFLLDGRRQKNHRHFPERGVPFQAGGNIAAVHVGHHDIEQDQIRFELPRRFQHPRAEIFLAHFVVAGLFEVQFQQARDACLIIDDQDALFAHNLSFRCALNMMLTLTPPSFRLMIRIIPPYNSTTFLSTIKSRIPFRIISVANDRSDLSASLLSMTPGPSSSTSAMMTVSPAFNRPGVRPLQPWSWLNCLRQVLTVRVPPPAIAWMALSR